ncbi:Bug family tripartite tricarboxylate transporter substrate binding protein [Muricoccus radiodurans]|uniref:Bug family tripartite tricarboxylate transporter substrate binding protein n=1 Tax=Muricoccus radiodurans TaxID=2231721 RepID=UPI003CF73F04
MPPLPRRALLAAPVLLVAGRAGAQPAFPNRPVTMVMPYAPGGGTDQVGRAVAQIMERELGTPVVVENRPGANTGIGATHVVQSRPDGHTLFFGANALAINPALQPNLTPRDPQRELAPIGEVYENPLILHVHTSLGTNTLADFAAYARAHPGAVNYGTSGNGSFTHLLMEMLAREGRFTAVNVPYRGNAPALLDLRAGRLQAMFTSVLEADPLLREGITKALAVSSATRLPVVPDLPAVAETFPGYDVAFWLGLFAPAGTPEPIIARLAAALRAATTDAALRERLAPQGVTMLTGDADALRARLARDTDTWGRLIRDANIRPD